MEGGRGTGGSQQQHVPTGAWVPLGLPRKGRGPGYPQGRPWSLTALPGVKGVWQRPTAFIALSVIGKTGDWGTQDGTMEVEGGRGILLQGHCGSPEGR